MAKNFAQQFYIKKCLFGANDIAKNSDKRKYMYRGYELAFDAFGSCSFGNVFGRNVTIFGVHNSSLSHTNSCKNNFLLLGEGFSDNINGNIDVAERKFSINFSKAKTKFCLSVYYSEDDCCLLPEKK